MLEAGKRAPAFTLQSNDGGKVSLKDFAGKSLVLYFYPKDDTPGCTLEAQDFQKALPTFKKRKVAVLGVSADTIEKHCKFQGKYGLEFPLLSDPDHAVIEKYGAWGEKNMYGKKSMGIVRTTVLIDGEGIVKKVWSKVRVKDHVAAVLAALDA